MDLFHAISIHCVCTVHVHSVCTHLYAVYEHKCLLDYTLCVGFVLHLYSMYCVFSAHMYCTHMYVHMYVLTYIGTVTEYTLVCMHVMGV